MKISISASAGGCYVFSTAALRCPLCGLDVPPKTEHSCGARDMAVPTVKRLVALLGGTVDAPSPERAATPATAQSSVTAPITRRVPRATESKSVPVIRSRRLLGYAAAKPAKLSPMERLERPSLSINQAAAQARVSRRSIYNWIRAGKVQFFTTPGGAFRVYADSLPPSEQTGVRRR